MNEERSIGEFLGRLNHLVETLIKLKLDEIKGERSQKDMILYLDGLGCSSGEIAKLLGVRETNVYPTISRARQLKKTVS